VTVMPGSFDFGLKWTDVIYNNNNTNICKAHIVSIRAESEAPAKLCRCLFLCHCGFCCIWCSDIYADNAVIFTAVNILSVSSTAFWCVLCLTNHQNCHLRLDTGLRWSCYSPGRR